MVGCITFGMFLDFSLQLNKVLDFAVLSIIYRLKVYFHIRAGEHKSAFQSVWHSFQASTTSWLRVFLSLWLISSRAERSAAPVFRVVGWDPSWCPRFTKTTNGIQTWRCTVHLEHSCLHFVCRQKFSTLLTDRPHAHTNTCTTHVNTCTIYAKALMSMHPLPSLFWR